MMNMETLLDNTWGEKTALQFLGSLALFLILS